MITEQQKQQILQQGMALEQVEEQLKNFEKNFPFLNIQAPAIIGDGIIDLSEEELKHFITIYEQLALYRVIVKFVPASGAASRMFKELYAYMESDKDDLSKNDAVRYFMDNFSSFAFYKDLDQSMEKTGKPIQKALEERKYKLILEHLLGEEGLDYGNLPKGLLKFHKYEKENRTPVHEHFVEGAQYGLGKDNTVRCLLYTSPSP